MNRILTLLLLFSTTFLFAQDTIYYNIDQKKVSKDSEFATYEVNQFKKEKNRYFSETYNTNHSLRWKSSYKDSLYTNLDGESIVYFENSNKIKSLKNYVNDTLHGELTTYWKNGTLRRKDLFENGKLKEGVCYDSNAVVIPHFDYEIIPEYIGGESKLLKDISLNTKYPFTARENNIQGKVYLSFIVNEEGNVENIQVTKSVHPLLDNAALKCLTKTFKKNKFTPGYEDLEPVKVQYNMPINFNIPKDYWKTK